MCIRDRLRRVGEFDPEIVRRAIQANQPTRIVLNHLDYVDPEVRQGFLTAKAHAFVEKVETAIGRHVDWLGVGPDRVVEQQLMTVPA